MGKKGGKKKAKKTLTDEEKLLAAEQAALEAANETAVRKELATKFLTEKLAQEEKNTRISVRKLNEQWRHILRKAKTDELQKEIEILSQTFERVLDRKNAIIKSLVQEIDEASRQEEMALQAHVQNVDHLIAFQENLLEELHAEFESKLDTLKTEFLDERTKVIGKHEAELLDVKDMLFAMHMQNEDGEAAASLEFNSKRDEVRTKNIEARETLKQDLEKVISDLWELFQQALRNYQHSTADKQAEFERLRAKDTKSAATIEKQTRKLNRLSTKINTLKARLASEQKDCEQRNRSLKQEKEKVLVHFQRLKGQMNKSRATNKSRLLQLTVESRKCSDALQERKGMAEHLLKKAEMCRKLETEEEKVVPFYAESLKPEEIEAAMGGEETVEVSNSGATATVETADGKAIREFHMMDNFWKRHNKVLLDKLAVEKEQEELEEENFKLRSVLKKYLDGISVNESVLSQDNTLFIVNGQTNAPMVMPVGDRRVRGNDAPQAQVTVQTLGLQQMVR